MDLHNVAHYGIAAVLAGGLAFTQLPKHDPWTAAGVPPDALGKHEWVIYAQPGSGEMPNELAALANAGGGHARIESASNAYVGVWVAPDNEEGHRVADALSKALGVTVVVDNYELGAQAYGTPYQIGIGSRPR